jgi:hypothetical protein
VEPSFGDEVLIDANFEAEISFSVADFALAKRSRVGNWPGWWGIEGPQRSKPITFIYEV